MKIPVQQVKPKNTPKVLREFDAQPALEFKDYYDEMNMSVFRLKDGRIILVSNAGGFGVIYPDEESLRKMIAYIEQQPLENTQHLSVSYPAFLDDVPSLTDQFREKLGLNYKILDGSLKSLKKADRELRKLLKSSEDVEGIIDNLFPAIIAYCTQVLLKEMGGELFMDLSAQGDYHIPSIRTVQRRVYSALAVVSEELVENPLRCSLFAAIDAEMYKYGLDDAVIKPE